MVTRTEVWLASIKEDAAKPLHDRDTIREQIEDSVFADRDLTRPIPKYRFPADGSLPRDASQLVSDELMLDGNARQNLATFCQTWVEPEVKGLMTQSISKNEIDRDEHPQTAEIERRCVHMMADLWHAPEEANTTGASAIGSPRRACWPGWRPSGGGEPSAGPRASRPTIRTRYAARCRWYGTSSPGTGTSRSGRSRWPLAAS